MTDLILRAALFLLLGNGLVAPQEALHGRATWYDYHRGQAAAGADLRVFLGADWRGQSVTVCGPVGCRTVRLTDYMSSRRAHLLVDLDRGDFRRVCGPLRRKGICTVTVTEFAGLPATDTVVRPRNRAITRCTTIMVPFGGPRCAWAIP